MGELERCLADLEDRIDPDVEETLHAEWRAFCDGEVESGFFAPRRGKQAPPAFEWPRVSVNEALESPERMALQQFRGCSDALAGGSGALMNVRANFGTGILSSLFGAEIFIMDEELDTLPTTWPIVGGAEAIERLVKKGVPGLDTAYGGRTLDMGRWFVDLMKDYPKVSRYVSVYHPDLQGPMDLCELMWGSGLFVDLVEKPDLVKAFLSLITDTYIAFMREWQRIVPPAGDYCVHWGLMLKGQIMLRDDSAMNLSPDMFQEFIAPYDQRLLNEFGGGAVHFCGRGEHYIHHLCAMDNVHAVNATQPELNDMETIFQHTVDAGILLIGLRRSAAEEAAARARQLHGNAQC